jgi:hypothetical protein
MAMRRLFLTFSLILLAAAAAPAATTYAVLVGGIGEEPYTRWTNDWLGRFRSYLTKQAGVPAAQITLLSGDVATSDAITKTIRDLAGRMQPADQFILILSGHGEIAGQLPTLAVRGPDLTAPQLGEALKSVPAKSQIVLNFSATSGDFLKHLAAPNRVNIAAVSPTEIKQPVFAEFFLRGLESGRAGTDPKKISLLQAFNWAAQQTPLWIARWELTEAGKWKANGRETVEIFKKLYAGVPNRTLDPASDAKAEDAPVQLQPPNGEVTKEWANRRVIDEHAILEDNGLEVGVSVFGDAGYQPILGAQEKDPGFLAGKTVLGRP